MRIIGGKFKRRLIDYPSDRGTRPMTDRAKETLFNILGSRVDESKALDLFAGSGSLGLEAYSRGAKTVCFVDQSQHASACITRNLERLQIVGDVIRVLKIGVEQAIRQFQVSGEKFDLVFIDPPYNKGLVTKILKQLDHSDILSYSSILVVGHSNRERVPDDLSSMLVIRSIKIGQGFLSFLERQRHTHI
jgi:16S rRNA (guanine966-N2)-methyltransferase